MGEMKWAIKKQKNNKAPGPDKCTTELFKLMDDKNIGFVFSLLNFCWRNETAPEELVQANVASIFKKGDVDLPSNYRPISFLNIIYKLYAANIQKLSLIHI